MGAIDRGLAPDPRVARDAPMTPPAEFAHYQDEPPQMRAGAVG